MKTKEFFCQAGVRRKGDQAIKIFARFEVLLAVNIRPLSFWM